jgi:hypothetical protein
MPAAGKGCRGAARRKQREQPWPSRSVGEVPET